MAGPRSADIRNILGQALGPSERGKRRLFWRDDMENYTVNKWPRLPGVNDVAEYVNDEIPAFEGDYVLSINNPVDRTSAKGVQFGLLPDTRNSVELRWWKDANLDYMYVYFHLINGTNERAIDIRWVEAPISQWEYVPSTVIGYPAWDDWLPILGGLEELRDDTWNYLKVIGDFENNRYYRLITTRLDIDLRSLPLRVFPNILAPPDDEPFTNLSLITATAAVNQPSYFDDVRIYINDD